MIFPNTENELELMLSEPSPRLLSFMSELKGDIIVLGANGKMGVSLARMAKRAFLSLKSSQRVIAVSRFTEKGGREKLESLGIETISCDLLNPREIERLPKVENVIFMAGRKFGTSGGTEPLTWAMNVLAPANVARHFKDSRIVIFSTGCIYPLVPVSGGGCSETEPANPVGEYAQSCLGRERVFEYFSNTEKTQILLYRLNYASDLRYGVLYDIALKVWKGEPFSGGAGFFNTIWQGDANSYALLSLGLCGSPAEKLNVTGSELLSVRDSAEAFASIMGKAAVFSADFEDKSYLNNASKLISCFGAPRITAEELIRAQAHWIMRGGQGLDKPTHFEVIDGKY
ncbi:MAG: epimerase [Lentisphaerae bacterium GWF2_52_8]|nr:MAG: epimerase [Lentisphaerae bacterium GWF2_52_8]